MTIGGWIMMILSYSVVLALTVFCFFKVLTTPGMAEHEHAPLEIDTQDTDD